MKNNYKILIIIIVAGKEIRFERYVIASSVMAAAIRAEEFYEEQGFCAFCKPSGTFDNRIPWDIGENTKSSSKILKCF